MAEATEISPGARTGRMIAKLVAEGVAIFLVWAIQKALGGNLANGLAFYILAGAVISGWRGK